MGNQNIQGNDHKNILFVGSDCLEEKYLLDKFFSNYKIETVGNMENIKITLIQKKSDNECAVWLLRFNDVNFINTLNVLIKTVKITGLVVCFFEEDEMTIKQMRIFLKQYTCEEYLRGVSLGIIVLDEENPFKVKAVSLNYEDNNEMKNEQQEKSINLYMRQLKVEKELQLRELDPRIIKQIQIMNIIQTSRIGETVAEFLEKIIDAANI